MNGDNVLQTSPMQQLLAVAAAGNNPNRRWSQLTATTPPPSNHLAKVSPPPHFFLPQNEPPPSLLSWHHDHHNNQEFQDSSLSQLLMSGLVGDEEDDKLGLTQMQKVKKLENWEEQVLHDDDRKLSANGGSSMVVKQEASFDRYGYGEDDDEFGGVKPANWSDQMIQSLCPNSCLITRNKTDGRSAADHGSSESNCSGSGGSSKKAKVEPPSSTQSTFKDCDEEPRKNLKSVGLCLVPVSCTMQVGSDNGADYWAPANNLQL
ncbi:hypothetical protein Ccrd_004061 [Cynara cardunculus var. scolymus]|uniref:Uncharacterized protein n=1 Tax=Cynara cardunculus var. scolymus TaxID=59895 RepID=A0A124SCI3_CYNCS|nr:hypothetical protein Ccrd_004061 [Cynara cardunculus var. scolymus]